MPWEMDGWNAQGFTNNIFILLVTLFLKNSLTQWDFPSKNVPTMFSLVRNDVLHAFPMLLIKSTQDSTIVTYITRSNEKAT